MLFVIRVWFIALLVAPATEMSSPEPTDITQATSGAAFAQLLSLEGSWIDLDGTLTEKGDVAITYRVTSGGSAVIETVFPGQPYEMVTVFHRAGEELALTHYCSLGNQPQMRSVQFTANALRFSLSGGTGLDASKDRYMHSRVMHLRRAMGLQASGRSTRVVLPIQTCTSATD